jgi:putative heme-binding domain-containing protein
MPRLDKMTGEQLATALDSPSGWQRDMAQQLLIERQDKAAVAPLEKIARECKRAEARVQAICTLDGLKAITPALLAAALKDEHPGVRRHAVRLCESLMNQHPDLGKAVAALAADADPHVRQQVAYSLGEWKDAAAGEALARVLIDSSDNSVLQAAALSSLKLDNMEATLQAVGRVQGKSPPSPSLIGALARMVREAQYVAVTAALLNGVTHAGPNDRYDVWQFLAAAAIEDAMPLRETRETNPKLQDLPAFRDLKQAIQQEEVMIEAARKLAADPSRPEAERIAALSLLGRVPNKQADDRELVVSLLSPGTAASVQAAAITAIARSRSKDVPVTLLSKWKRYTPQLRGAVLDTLLSRPNWATALLDAVEKGDVKPLDIDPARRQAMTLDKNADISSRAKKLLAAAVNPDRQKVIDAMKSGVTAAKADAKHGAEVFTKTCVTCHAVAGVGNAVGPDLASVGDKSPDGLLVAILDPNRAVEPRFVSYVIETKAGDTLTGLLASESGNAITLLGPDGKSQQILRSDIKELRGTGLSLMPEGLESGLQPQDLADLIAYVQTVRPVGNRRAFPGNQPALVVPREKGLLKLTPATAEITGKTIVLETRHGNLGYWSSQEDEAAWSTQPARAGTYDVWVDYACEKPNHGNELLIQVGSGDKAETKLTWRVEATAIWDTYRKVRIGVVKLEAGRQRISVRSNGAIKGALLDLREIELVPQR